MSRKDNAESDRDGGWGLFLLWVFFVAQCSKVEELEDRVMELEAAQMESRFRGQPRYLDISYSTTSPRGPVRCIAFECQ